MADLTALPVEMIDRIASSLSDNDILRLRSRCRALRNGTNHEFCKRFFKKPFKITGTSTEIRKLLAILETPDFPSAKVLGNFSHDLVVYKPPVPLGNETTVPTAEDVDRLFAALPGLKTLSIGAEEATDLFHFDINGGVRALETRVNNRENIAPVLLKGLVRANLPLTTLNLCDIAIEGATLVEALVTHEASLKLVNFKLVCLKDGKDAVAWPKVYEALLALDDLQKCVLEYLGEPDLEHYVVLLQESDSDCEYSVFYSHHPSVRVKRRGDEGLEEGDVLGFASYTRSKATFVDDYVSLGLKRLLHTADFAVFHWPRY